MSRGISLAPCELAIERIETEADKLLILARSIMKTAACPTCGSQSDHIHSRYQRSLTDLPSQGRAVEIGLSVICVQKVPLRKVGKINDIALRAEAIWLI